MSGAETTDSEDDQMTTAQPVEPGQIRIGDTQREQMAGRLARAHALGQLELDEFDSRVQRAYAARVQKDLDMLTLDLPLEHADRGPSPDGLGRDRGPSSRPRGGWSSGSDLPPWLAGGRAHWQQRGPAQWRGGAIPRPVWIVLAVLLALMVVGPIIGFLFRVLFTLMVIAGIIVVVGKVRDRRRR